MDSFSITVVLFLLFNVDSSCFAPPKKQKKNSMMDGDDFWIQHPKKPKIFHAAYFPLCVQKFKILHTQEYRLILGHTAKL